MPDNGDLLPPDLEKLITRYTERGIAIPVLRRLVRDLLKLGLPVPQIESAVARRLSQVGGGSLPPPNYEAMRQALLPTEPGPGWPFLSGALKAGGLMAGGGLLLGGSTPRSEHGLEYGAQYSQMFGEPDPSIFGGVEDPERVAQVQAALRPPAPAAMSTTSAHEAWRLRQVEAPKPKLPLTVSSRPRRKTPRSPRRPRGEPGTGRRTSIPAGRFRFAKAKSSRTR